VTDLRMMFESRYIGAWDLRGRDVTVTIERIVGGVVEGENGRKDKAPIVSFRGKKKPMVLNKTNMKTIASLYGTFDAEKLLGKRVTLYGTTCKAKGGGMVDCVRIRNVIPVDPDSAESLDEPVDEAMQRKQQDALGGERQPGED
jgi:hypothetical protein